MPKFRVEVNGSNFFIDMEGKVAKYGFITFLVVEAGDANAAESIAIAGLRSTERLRSLVRNDSGDPPVMDVREIVQVDTFDNEDDQQPSFLWYEENPKRWWQFWKRP